MGVAVIVAVTGVLPLFCAMNGAILPVPFAARPMVGVSLVQLNVLVEPLKLTGLVAEPAVTV